MYTSKKGKRNVLTQDITGLDTVGGRIRAARIKTGLTVTEAAKRIGLSRPSLSLWESDDVKTRDNVKLGEFVKLTDVSLDWLLERKGPDPDLTPHEAGKRRDRAVAAAAQLPQINGSGNTLTDTPIVEIAPALSAHASHLDLAPRAYWVIPHQVIEIGFNSEPETTAMKRVVTKINDDLGICQGDYLMIDYSRTRIDEAGLYLVADPDGKSARKVKIVKKEGSFEVASVADALQREIAPEAVESLISLGRIMGIFKPT